MLSLTKKQLSFLKRLSKTELDCKTLSNDEYKTLMFLDENGFVDITRELVPDFFNGQPNPYKGKCLSAHISEAGKSFLTERAIDNKRYRQPLMVSIISILIALLALLLSAASLYLQLQQ